MSDVTRILSQIQGGNRAASDELLPIVYEELRRLARSRLANESPDATLQATALVHEVYLRLVDAQQEFGWNSRGHFFGAAAEAMRRILIEHARKRKSLKRGGAFRKQGLESVQMAVNADPEKLLALNEALDEFAQQNELGAELVKRRYFAGMTLSEAANSLEISKSTADRTWAYARAWLYRRLAED